MQSTIWTIALISVGIVTPNIQHMGYFLEEKDCKQALVELKSQELGLKIKGVCIQHKMPPDPPPVVVPAPIKPPTPTESFGSSDAKSRKK